MKTDYRITVRDDSHAWHEFCQRLAREGVPDDAPDIYDGRRNRLRRMPAPDGRGNIIVKAFGVPNIINRWAYAHLRPSKARRSYYNALRLEQAGFSTPRPEAYIEVRRGGRLYQSYYISREVDAPQIRHWERRPDAAPMLEAFADDIVRLHRSGILHKDFSPGNILVSGSAESGYRFYYIDLNRMVFNEHRPRRLLTMFGRMHDDEQRVCELVRAYDRALLRAADTAPRGIHPGMAEAAAVRVYRRYWAAHRRKQRLRHH